MTHLLCDENGHPILSGTAEEMLDAEIAMRASGFECSIRLARDLWDVDSMTWRNK